MRATIFSAALENSVSPTSCFKSHKHNNTVNYQTTLFTLDLLLIWYSLQ